MSTKPRPPLPLPPDQNQQISQDQYQNLVDKQGEQGDNTNEYTPNKFYNNDELSRTSERRDQPQRRRSDQRQPRASIVSENENDYLPTSKTLVLNYLHDKGHPFDLSPTIDQKVNSHNVTSPSNAPYHEDDLKSLRDQKPGLINSKNNRPRPPDPINPSISRLGTTSTGGQTRRQKSLVRPERARNRRNMNYQPDYQKNDNIENGDNRWSTFANNPGGLDRRRSQGPGDRRASNRASNVPPKKKKWYQCQCPSAWVMFSRCITCWAPPFLSCCVALVVIILILCGAVGFLTFGFDQVFCGQPVTRIRSGSINNNQISILGKVFNLNHFAHPPIAGIINSTNFERTAGGNDLTFMFQAVNFDCKGVFIPTQAANANGDVYNYFPCIALSNNNPIAPNNSLDPENSACHGSTKARNSLASLKFVGDIFYDWDDLQSPGHNYVVYNGHVLDMDRLQWIVPNINIPAMLKPMMFAKTNIFRGLDMTYYLQKNSSNIKIAKCLDQVLRVGVLDTTSIGCVISTAVMLVSLLFIAGVVLVRFFLAVLFGWILSWRLGNFREETAEEIAKREREIELWSNENNHFYPSTNKSRFSTPNFNGNPNSIPYGRRNESRASSRNNFNVGNGTLKEFNSSRNSRPSSINEYNSQSRADSMTSTSSAAQSATEYPKSHKLLLCIADGIIFGDGNELSTPDICVSLMTDHLIHPDEVEPHSYVAIADGKKRHNKAKVYAGYYTYRELDGRQDRVPMITIAKCGGPGEENETKPGNRGKRDSQIILMSFLQKVMFNERMTRLEYELFTAIRQVCNVTPDFFEAVLM
ncbi:3678_t:CDS:2, partial [Gigaspora rosea]